MSQGNENQSRLRGFTAVKISHKNRTTFVSVNVWEFLERLKMINNVVLIT
jgi:hypothetical protein